MLGPTERGPEYPVLVTSWLEYQKWFGGYLPLTESYFPYAVQGFFDNGGNGLYVARILGANAGFGSRDVGNLHIQAIGRGGWSTRVFVRIDQGSKNAQNSDLFKLTLLYYSRRTVPDAEMATFLANFIDPLDPAKNSDPNRREPDLVEMYDNLLHTRGVANFVETKVNSASNLMRVWMTSDPAYPIPTDNIDTFVQLSEADPVILNDDDIVADNYVGDLEPIDQSSPPQSTELLGRGRGLEAVAVIDEVSLLLAPDEVRREPQDLSQVTEYVITQCKQLRDRFAVVIAELGQNKIQDLRPPADTSYAAFFYPWFQVHNPVSSSPILIPPSGHIAGLITRTDIEQGVHRSPANKVVRSALNLEFSVTRDMQDVLNPRGVNCIRDFRANGRGIRLWGARTMSSDPQWRYINVRRLFLFVEKSIVEGIRWAVFEPNNESLWAQVRRSITTFLMSIWRDGALMGATPDEAFFVKCDRTTMTKDDIDNGRLVCVIGIAPLKPAEFIILHISQTTQEATG
jgi:phage tail sheath protein FI